MDLEASGRVAGNLEHPSRGASRWRGVDRWVVVQLAAAVLAGFGAARVTGLTSWIERVRQNPPAWLRLPLPEIVFAAGVVAFIGAAVMTYRYLCFRWIKRAMALKKHRKDLPPPGPAPSAAPSSPLEPTLAPVLKLDRSLEALDEWPVASSEIDPSKAASPKDEDDSCPVTA